MIEERELPTAVLVQYPQESFLLLSQVELEVIKKLVREKYPDQDVPLVNLERAEIEELLRYAYQENLIHQLESEQPRVSNVLAERAKAYAEDIESVKDGGVIRLFLGEGTHELYSHPAIVSAVKRANERGVAIKISAGPFLSAIRKGHEKESILVEFARRGWIQLYKRSKRGLGRHFGVLETPQGLKVRLEEEHEPGAPSEERKMVKLSRKEMEEMGEKLIEQFDRSIIGRKHLRELKGLAFDEWDHFQICLEILYEAGIDYDYPPGERVIFIPAATLNYVSERLKEKKVPFKIVELLDASEIPYEELVKLRRKYLFGKEEKP